MKEIATGTMLMYKVMQNKGEFVLTIKAEGGTINEWTLGMDEGIAKGKVKTILDTYANGMEFLQEEVRKVFAKVESAEEEVEQYLPN